MGAPSQQFTFGAAQDASGPVGLDQDEQQQSSLQRTFGNVMNLVNDGLYRIKNRAKSE